MGFRAVYGNTHSENGWRMCDRAECVTPLPAFGIPFTDTAPVRRGDAATILNAWVAWYHRNVEQISTPVWGWSLTNDVPNSNHLSGTAVDIHAPRYPFRIRTMPAEIRARVEHGLRLFEGAIAWGGHWTSPIDEMHYQLGWREGDPRVSAFADRLNAGHLGIYTPAQEDPMAALTDAEQRELLHKTREIWDQLRGPGGKGWPQLGTDSQGRNLTLVDKVAEIDRDVEELKRRP